MASGILCEKPVKYLNIALQRSSPFTEESVTAASPALSSASSTDDSDDSIFTSPTTPGTPPFWPSRPSTIYKRKETGIAKLIEPLDLGTSDDWLRWDVTESSQAEMNSLRAQDPEELVVFIEDPVSFSPLFQNRQLQATGIPQREIPYSPPPTWTYANVQSSQRQQQSQVPFLATVLTPQEEMRLRDIAMPPTKTPTTPLFAMPHPTSTSLAAQAHIHPILPNPQPPRLNINTNNGMSRQRKRKSKLGSTHPDSQLEGDSEGSEESSTTPLKPNPTPAGKGKKSSHNVIEKRYRNNLNDKITELRDSVPSLRVMSKHLEDDEDEMERLEEDLQGLTPAHKLNKATILSKATEYIAHLEKRNTYLLRENADLKSRVDAFEILVTSRPQQQQQQQQQLQRQDYQRGYEDGQRAVRQTNGHAVGPSLGLPSGWGPPR